MEHNMYFISNASKFGNTVFKRSPLLFKSFYKIKNLCSRPLEYGNNFFLSCFQCKCLILHLRSKIRSRVLWENDQSEVVSLWLKQEQIYGLRKINLIQRQSINTSQKSRLHIIKLHLKETDLDLRMLRHLFWKTRQKYWERYTFLQCMQHLMLWISAPIWGLHLWIKTLRPWYFTLFMALNWM